ncbi:MAG TPA: VOC family protein [Bacteroidales bacterium]|nr:VOC family protein [Bacteroidales bacterium]
MKIGHIAIWVNDLEKMKEFYIKYFHVSCNTKYENKIKNFSSYFLSFNDGAKIEIMHRPDITEPSETKGLINGLAHLAISVGSTEKVTEITERLRNDNYKIVSEPRFTGDGFFESVVLDPELNYIEITE